jgi:hypothetical protein
MNRLFREGATMVTRLSLVLLALAVAFVQPGMLAQEKEPPFGKADQGSKLDLTPESFPKLHSLVRPQENEWRHLKVHWLTDPVAALKKAAAEDKPLVFLYLGGAGYNAPLGIC